MPYLVGHKVRVIDPAACPPSIEVQFQDAAGRIWTVIDKEPVFGEAPASGRPEDVPVPCTVVHSAAETCTVRLSFGMEAVGEVTEFEVPSSSVQPD